MANKKKFILIVSMILLTAILVVSLTSCLKIGLKEKNVTARIEEEGGTYKSLLSKSPFIENAALDSSIEVILAKFNIEDIEQQVYIVYCDDDNKTELIKSQADEYLIKKRAEQAELLRQIEAGEKFIEVEKVVDYEHWISYEYDRCVMCGYYKGIAIIRQY